MTATQRLERVVRAFSGRRVLILGDMVADEYVMGRPAGISREAPVLILEHSRTFIRPGGATNSANNAAALGASVQVVGVVGDDDMGKRLVGLLADLSIDTRGLIVDSRRPTSTKTRIVGKGAQDVQQQIVRVDRVDRSPVGESVRSLMIDAVCRALPEIDALLVSDYENGAISQEVIDACLPRARRMGITITVDSHGDLYRFQDVTAATPNQPEAEQMIGRSIADDETLRSAGEALLAGMRADGVLITRGSHGMALFEPDGREYMLPVSLSDESEAVDPTGAGDTVAAVFTLAIASGADMRTAAYLANVAGGEVVRKFGPATIRAGDLIGVLKRVHLAPPS